MDKKIKQLIKEIEKVDNMYLDKKVILIELKRIIKNNTFYCKNENFVKNYYGEYCKNQCEECGLKSNKSKP